MSVLVEHVEDRWDHGYQPRLRGRFPDGCEVCNEVHEELVIYLKGTP